MEMKDSLSPASSSPVSEDVPMDDAAQSSGNSGDDEAPTNQSQSPREDEMKTEEEGAHGVATGNAAKFKASQDLRIQTANLPPAAKSKPRAHSVGSATGMGLTEEEEEGEGSADGGKTPGPVPCSTGKKRRRRTAAQIDRKYPCTYPGCTKAYGSEGSLTQHQRLKHRNQSPEPGVQAAQLNNFFLPLHRTPRGLSGAMGRSAAAGGARTVTIRPAGIDGLGLHSFDVAAAAASLVPENETIANDFLLASPSHTLSAARQQLRARSNSMPISFSTPSSLSLHFATPGPPPPPSATTAPAALSGFVPGPSSLSTSSASSTGETTPSEAKPKAARRSRQASTPRSGGKPPLRRTKCRSKSESLHDVMEPIVFQDEIRPPMMDRSSSDNAVRAAFPMGPAATSSSLGGPPFDWRFAIAHSQHSDSPVSSVEEAIDSDILSVLADYDTSDTGDSTLELVGSTSFDDATESSHASSSGGRFPEPEDEWLSQQDAQYLTTHLEKMSMIHDSPPGSLAAHAIVSEDDPMSEIKLEFPTAFDVMAPPTADAGDLKQEFPPVSTDTFAVHARDSPFVAGEDMKDGLKLHGSSPNDPSAELFGRDTFESTAPSGFKQDPEQGTIAAPPQPTWTKELAALEPYTSSGIDQADFMDVDSTSYGPLQWKSAEKLRPAASQALYAGSFDSLTAYLQHGDKQGMYTTLGDTFALDSVDYAMEEPRLSSPVICQQKDL